MGTNSGGPHTLKYGVTTNHVLGFELVLPDGDTVTYQSDQHRVAFSRGCAWCDWEEECRLTTRREYLAVEVTSRVGFRLARSIPEEKDE